MFTKEEGILLVEYIPSPMREKEVLNPNTLKNVNWEVIDNAVGPVGDNSLWQEVLARPQMLIAKWLTYKISIQERYNLGLEIIQALEYAWEKPARDWPWKPAVRGDWLALLTVIKTLEDRVWNLNSEYLNNINAATLEADAANKGLELIADLKKEVLRIKVLYRQNG